ncbi:sensor histidine kinase [Krasilnikovia sp. MM14-A1004]|uniref:sensor histidine kinase n=1 Tax=Krasilnikovia sp. MM14-A1004 TaxID=3373541 RepID=UPI00399C69B6
MALRGPARLRALAAAKVRGTPLRVKLLAAVLALVFAALTLISVASTLALRGYLLSRMDDELEAATSNLEATLQGIAVRQLDPRLYIPSEYMFAICDVHGVGAPYKNDRRLKADDLPTCPKGAETIDKLQTDQPFTVLSPSRRYHWRMMILDLPNGDYLYVGRNMTEIEYAVSRLVWIDLLVGTAVLLSLAVVGATIVRTSLRPLTDIEQTAGAIAAGDLTRRVPDPEPDSEEPQTELGRLSRALNAMLAQIETAFTARAQSETAARAAESVARDAADAAQLSEARAVRSEEKMRQFVADASHELRTPLTTIRGFAELYRQGAVADPADVTRLVRRIEDEAARMGLLVEDLLLLARLDRERPLTLAPVELPVLAVDAMHAAQATAPERRIEVDIRDDADKLIAYGDDARLRQVIGNLVTNALTHTPPEAEVTLRVFREDGNRVALEVSDTGPGLTAAQRERVFERFYRADEARTRHTDREATGTGLGLAIVAAIVRAHHGSVEVVSEEGGGATFRVALPALDADVPGEP